MQNYINLLFSISKTNAIISRNLHFNGIDFNDYMILYYLDKSINKKLSRIDLAEKLGLSPSGITRILLPLQKRGIIKNQEDASDARIKNAVLTKSGERILNEANTSLKSFAENIFPKMNAKAIIESKNVLDSMFNDFVQDEYKKEVKEKWGESEAYKQNEEKVKKMSKAQKDNLKKETDELTQKIANASENGVNSKEVQDLIAEHYKGVNFFYECSLEMYLNLGEMYVKDLRFASYYNKFKPGFSRFMRNAIKEFCKNNK